MSDTTSPVRKRDRFRRILGFDPPGASSSTPPGAAQTPQSQQPDPKAALLASADQTAAGAPRPRNQSFADRIPEQLTVEQQRFILAHEWKPHDINALVAHALDAAEQKR